MGWTKRDPRSCTNAPGRGPSGCGRLRPSVEASRTGTPPGRSCQPRQTDLDPTTRVWAAHALSRPLPPPDAILVRLAADLDFPSNDGALAPDGKTLPPVPVYPGCRRRW